MKGTPLSTIDDFRQAAAPGTRWMCIDRLHPEQSGVRIITAWRTTTLDYQGGQVRESWVTPASMTIPTDADVRFEGDDVHWLARPGSDRVIKTWTPLPLDAQHDGRRPPWYWAACPEREDLRGPAGTPWCVYSSMYDKAVDACGEPVTESAAYFASQTEAEALVEKCWPRGARWQIHAVAPPPDDDWEYVLDSTTISYGPGPWPFHDDEDRVPHGIRLSPDTKYYAWGNEYAGIYPDRFGGAETVLDLYVRQHGVGAILVRCRVTFDLFADTFTIDDSCPMELREQALNKSQKIVGLIAAARRERDTYVRPRTAHEQYWCEKAATNGKPAVVHRERREQSLPELTWMPDDVSVVRQGRGIWQRIGPDEWLTAEVGNENRPLLYRFTTAGMLRLGPVQPLASPPLAELEQVGTALVGRTIAPHADTVGSSRWDFTVDYAESGFLYGRNRGYRYVLHLIAVDLYDAGQAEPWGSLLVHLPGENDGRAGHVPADAERKPV